MSSGSVKKLVRKVLSDRARGASSGDSSMKELLAIEKWPKEWYDRIKQAEIVAAYMPIKDELAIHDFLSSLSSKTICLPRVEGDDIVFYKVSGEADLQAGNYGIKEPKDGLPSVDKKDIDILLIPASAYGLDGHRLGRGKGFYDRYCDGRGTGAFRAQLIGVVPETDLLAKVPFEEWDVAVDAICTEKRFIEVEV